MFFSSQDKLIIDEKKIQELKNILDVAFPNLINIFIQDTKDQIKKLEDFVKNKKHSEVKAVSHSMKGASANIGAKYLCTLTSEIEDYCKKEDWQSMIQIVESMKKHHPILTSLLQKISH